MFKVFGVPVTQAEAPGASQESTGQELLERVEAKKKALDGRILGCPKAREGRVEQVPWNIPRIWRRAAKSGSWDDPRVKRCVEWGA